MFSFRINIDWDITVQFKAPLNTRAIPTTLTSAISVSPTSTTSYIYTDIVDFNTVPHSGKLYQHGLGQSNHLNTLPTSCDFKWLVKALALNTDYEF